MTVREAFSKAFGPVPDDATCHVGYYYFTELRVQPVYCHNHNVYATVSTMMDDQVWQGFHFDGERTFGPDISDRPASAFLGFFGAEYDAVVNSEVQP
jgi:hypothetical protein